MEAQQEVTPEKLIGIIGMKEVEISLLREQIQQLLQEKKDTLQEKKDNV